MTPASPLGTPLWDVLARYVAGESPAEEAENVRRWLADDPQRAEMVKALAGSISTYAATTLPDVDVESALRRVKVRFSEPEVHSISEARRLGGVGIPWRIAAALALLAGAGIVWRTIQSGPAAVNTPALRTYTTRIGQSDSVTLPDGTLAILGPGSSLEMDGAYGSGTRSVELRGQAFFQVVHDEQRPFLVRAANGIMQDLGTAFMVRDDADALQVVVTEGSVSLQGNEARQGTSQSKAKPAAPQADEATVLRAGDRGILGRDGRLTVERAAATPDDLAWTRGRLLFEDAPLSRVRSDLRRWYGIELVVADSALAGRHLTASFAGEPAQQVLGVISLALGARIERRGDTAFVRAK